MRGDTHVRFGGAGRGTRSSERAIPRPGPTPTRPALRRPPAAALFTAEAAEGTGDRTGLLVEYDRTDSIFTQPVDKRTEDYVTGRFG